jgi:hypothetical protein
MLLLTNESREHSSFIRAFLSSLGQILCQNLKPTISKDMYYFYLSVYKYFILQNGFIR